MGGRRPGRPPLDGERAAEQLSIRIPTATVTALRARASRQGRPVSELIREALDLYTVEGATAS